MFDFVFHDTVAKLRFGWAFVLVGSIGLIENQTHAGRFSARIGP